MSNRILIPTDDYILFIKKQLKSFPQCKVDEYIEIKFNKNQRYKSVNSKLQIQTLLHLKQNKIGFYHYHRLLQMLAKDVDFYDYFYLLKYLKKEKLNDQEVYKFLQKHIKNIKNNNLICKNGGAICCNSNIKNKTGGALCSRNKLFNEVFSIIFKRFFMPNNKKLKLSITNYLDIGCGDCKQTKILGNAIGLSDDKIYGADISHWGGYNEEKRSKVGINIIGLKEDGILPFENNSFCLISAFMVLHHVRPLEKLLSEIVRILKPNGYFFIREHDAMYAADYMLCDIEHAMYDVVQRNDMTFFNTYHGVYYDWLEWDYLLNKFGLRYVFADYNSNSIYYNLTTNRSFYGIYYKI